MSLYFLTLKFVIFLVKNVCNGENSLEEVNGNEGAEKRSLENWKLEAYFSRTWKIINWKKNINMKFDFRRSLCCLLMRDKNCFSILYMVIRYDVLFYFFSILKREKIPCAKILHLSFLRFLSICL